VRQLILKESTIMYAKFPITIFPNLRRMLCHGSYFRNGDFISKSVDDKLEDLVLVENEFTTQKDFNILKVLPENKAQFKNLRRLEYHGFFDDQSFKHFLKNLAELPSLVAITLVNQNLGFNIITAKNDYEISTMNMFANLEKLNLDNGKSRWLVKINISGETQTRRLDITFQRKPPKRVALSSEGREIGEPRTETMVASEM